MWTPRDLSAGTPGGGASRVDKPPEGGVPFITGEDSLRSAKRGGQAAEVYTGRANQIAPVGEGA